MQQKRAFDIVGFDVDGTLIEHPTGKVIWELLNLRYGCSEDVNSERHQMYRAGQINYDEWVALDVQGWIRENATRDEILEVVRGFRLNEGAREAVSELRRRGYRLAVISGTLDIVIDTLFPNHPFTEVFTNRIFFNEDGRLSSWEATPFDIYGKPVALKKLARKYDTHMDRIAYVGDGENDVPLLDVVGFFIAFHPRSEELERRADMVIRGESMEPILDVFL